MTFPTVTEQRLSLEPVAPDPFIAALDRRPAAPNAPRN
jgi:hypothetical protein